MHPGQGEACEKWHFSIYSVYMAARVQTSVHATTAELKRRSIINMEYISFPGLGLQIPVTRVAFDLFGFEIYTYAIIISFSLLLSLILSSRNSEKFGISQNDFLDLMIFTIPAAIICARLYYVVFSLETYNGSILAMLNVRNGGLAIYGAIIGAFAAVFIFSKVKKINPFVVLDFGVPYLVLSQGIGRWANFVNQEAFGGNTLLPWGMTSNVIVNYLNREQAHLESLGIFVDPALPVHPTFLYESIWNLLVAVFLFSWRKKKQYNGELTLFYLIGYGIGRMFIEQLRMDSLMIGGLRVSQVLSALLVISCLFLYGLFHKKRPAIFTDAHAVAEAADGNIEETDWNAEEMAEYGEEPAENVEEPAESAYIAEENEEEESWDPKEETEQDIER